MAAPRKVLVVGGGITGLTAAYELSKDPRFSITLVESSPQLGGLAAGFPLLGTSLEKAYHHLFLTDTSILALVKELGLSDSLVWYNSSVGIYRGGRCYSFTSPLDLLRFRPCGLFSRVRLGLVALYLKHQRNWRPFLKHRAHEWMRKACGRQAMASVWTPLLKGKFDRYYDSVSMAWLWARIHTRANSRGPGGGREKLGYFTGGFAVVVRKLEAELRRREVRIETGVSVDAFAPQGHRAICGGREIPFDDCIFTGPSPALAKLLPDSPACKAYAEQLRSVDYLGAICLVFVSDQDLGDFYWLNVNEPNAPFLVFVNHTRLTGREQYQGKNVYYIGAYLPTDVPLYSLPDEALTELWWNYLKTMFPEFDPARCGERQVFRFKAAQHIVDTDYEAKIPAYRTPLPGVFLANFSQIFPEDRGTNWAVSEGLKIAALVREDAEKAAGPALARDLPSASK